MDQPLVGSREQNYRFFYTAGGAAMSSLLILLIITGYTAYISTSAGNLISDMNEVISDLKIIIPDVQESIEILDAICIHKNFTNRYGSICGKSPTPAVNFLLD